MTLTGKGTLEIKGKMPSYSGVMDLTLTEAYQQPMTTDDLCFGVPFPDVPYDADLPRELKSLPLKREIYNYVKHFKLNQYQIVIMETWLDTCPGCG